jgi:hypothetical protein
VRTPALKVQAVAGLAVLLAAGCVSPMEHKSGYSLRDALPHEVRVVAIDPATNTPAFADAVGTQLSVRHGFSVWDTERVARWLEERGYPPYALASDGDYELELAPEGVDAVILTTMPDSSTMRGPSWVLWVLSTHTGKPLGSASSKVVGGWGREVDPPEGPPVGEWEHSVALADALAEMLGGGR